MPRCREKLPELDYIIWDGSPETANSFLGEQYGIDWEFDDSPDGSIWFRTSEENGKAFAAIGDAILKDECDYRWLSRGETFAHAYETIKED